MSDPAVPSRRPAAHQPPPPKKHSLFPASVATSLARQCGRLHPVFTTDVSRTAGRTTVSLPEHADSAFELEEAHTGVSLSARLVGARPVPSEVSQGYVIYRDALPNGVNVIHVPASTGTEDILTLDGPKTTSVSYKIDLGDKVAGLRLFANTLELLDASGMPRLRVSPPYLLDANLKRHTATLGLAGCVADTGAAPPWDHPPQTLDAKSCTLKVSWNAAELTYPALLDPSWNSTASLATERAGHVAGRLNDGTVLAAGGYQGASMYDGLYLDTVERFQLGVDGTGAWAAAAPMKGGTRYYALGASRDNRFYVIEGYADIYDCNRGTAEFFSTTTNDWTETAPELSPLRVRNANGSATVLLDGRILVVGGDKCEDNLPQRWVDIYDPVLNQWTHGPDLPGDRGAHAAVRVSDGRVLVVGGRQDDNYTNPDWVSATFFFDPNQNQWFDGPTLDNGRLNHNVVSLSPTSLDILVFGGVDANGFPAPPARWTGGTSFRTLSSGLVSPREWGWDGWEKGGTALRDGSALAIWGWGMLPEDEWGFLPDAEVFNPVTEEWSSTGDVEDASHRARGELSITDLPNAGKVLLVGGLPLYDVASPLADLYTYAAPLPPPPVVISQVYGGGGQSGGLYTNDFVELFNAGTTPASLNGWSVQYASATGGGTFAGNQRALLSGTIAPGQHYLVKFATSGTSGSPLPQPDATGTQNLSATGAKIALVNTTTGLACNTASSCDAIGATAKIVDLVGYGTANYFEGTGAAPLLSVTTAARRRGNGCVDTNDNKLDFKPGAPNPRNTSSPLGICGEYCGDAIVDTMTEECDPGDTVNDRAVCSADCRVRDLLAIADTIGSPATLTRRLGEGRHPLATSADGAFAFVFVEPDRSPLRLGLSTYDADGVPSDTVIPISVGSTPLRESNPVIAAVPGGKYAVAYTDFEGDGDERGIALRLIDPSSAPTSSPTHANTTTRFAQYDADLMATPNGLVAAWLDDSNLATAPDIKFRTFGFDLAPTSEEQILADSVAHEGNVALAPFVSGWAAAWRAGQDAAETLFIRAGSTNWSIGPYAPGPVGDRPALAEIDATHLLVVYTQGSDPGGTGVVNGSELRAAVLNTAQPGAVQGLDIVARVGCDELPLSQSHPAAARVGNEIYVGWRSKARRSDSRGEELWVKKVTWSLPGPIMDWTSHEVSLPRVPGHREGDQRRIALAARTVSAQPQLVAAYDDLGGTLVPASPASTPVVPPAQGVVALEVIPTPIARIGEAPNPGCAPGVPYRLLATVTASEAATGYPPSNADDQDEATQWVANLDSSASNNNAWVQLDLGSAKQVDRLRWTGADGSPAVARSPSEYTVETSDDAVTWSVVTSRVASSVTNGSEFVGKIARFVRLKTTKVFDGSGAALSLFEIWAEGVGFAPGDTPRWQVFDSFDQPLSSSIWNVLSGTPVTSGGKLNANFATSGVIQMISTGSFQGRSLHLKDIHEVPGSGRCWSLGLIDPTWQHGVLLRRDLSPDSVDAAIQDHLFFQVIPATGSPTYTDLGAFNAGPGLDVTYGWYGANMHVDVSKDGGALLHREVDTALLPTSMGAFVTDYCGANITIDDVLASAP